MARAKSFAHGLRLATYWLTVLAFLISCTWYVVNPTENGWTNYIGVIGEALNGDLSVDYGRVGRHSTLVMPMLFVTTLCALFITTVALPFNRSSWVNKFFSFFRKFKLATAEEGNRMAKANQFLRGTGQLNFNYVGIVVAVIPSLINFVIYCAQTPKYYPADNARSLLVHFAHVRLGGHCGSSLLPDTGNAPQCFARCFGMVAHPRFADSCCNRLVCVVEHRAPRFAFCCRLVCL
mmetsp:Transcript_11682/g.21239  ORF Transcript_11682/g.21239 Transcript_11682/m.21239 type:complete len:235 (-) Transcript_11682:1969-2673(-)